jgi:hypothetical protein
MAPGARRARRRAAREAAAAGAAGARRGAARRGGPAPRVRRGLLLLRRAGGAGAACAWGRGAGRGGVGAGWRPRGAAGCSSGRAQRAARARARPAAAGVAARPAAAARPTALPPLPHAADGPGSPRGAVAWQCAPPTDPPGARTRPESAIPSVCSFSDPIVALRNHARGLTGSGEKEPGSRGCFRGPRSPQRRPMLVAAARYGCSDALPRCWCAKRPAGLAVGVGGGGR